MNQRIQTIIAEVSEEMEVKIENGLVSSNHLHLFVVILPYVAVSSFVQRTKVDLCAKFNKNLEGLKRI